MSFLVLAYPVISSIDFEWIQSYRKSNDILFYNIVNPHFTVVFQTELLPETEFVDEILLQSKGINEIEFELRSAILHKDDLNDYYYEFLIPQKGHSEIVELHDRIYSNRLSPEIRKDIKYIPHITIGNSRSAEISERRLTELDSFTVKGKIEYLTIINFQKNYISKILDIQLIQKT